MQIKIQSENGDVYEIEVDEEDTVLTIKEKILEKMGATAFGVDDMTLIYNDTFLANEQICREFYSDPNRKILLAIKKRTPSVNSVEVQANDSSGSSPTLPPTPPANLSGDEAQNQVNEAVNGISTDDGDSSAGEMEVVGVGGVGAMVEGGVGVLIEGNVGAVGGVEAMADGGIVQAE